MIRWSSMRKRKVSCPFGLHNYINIFHYGLIPFNRFMFHCGEFQNSQFSESHLNVDTKFQPAHFTITGVIKLPDLIKTDLQLILILYVYINTVVANLWHESDVRLKIRRK